MVNPPILFEFRQARKTKCSVLKKALPQILNCTQLPLILCYTQIDQRYCYTFLASRKLFIDK